MRADRSTRVLSTKPEEAAGMLRLGRTRRPRADREKPAASSDPGPGGRAGMRSFLESLQPRGPGAAPSRSKSISVHDLETVLKSQVTPGPTQKQGNPVCGRCLNPRPGDGQEPFLRGTEQTFLFGHTAWLVAS